MKKTLISIAFIFIFQSFLDAAVVQQGRTTHVHFELTNPSTALINLAEKNSQITSRSYQMTLNLTGRNNTTTCISKTWLKLFFARKSGHVTNYIAAFICSSFSPSDVSQKKNKYD